MILRFILTFLSNPLNIPVPTLPGDLAAQPSPADGQEAQTGHFPTIGMPNFAGPMSQTTHRAIERVGDEKERWLKYIQRTECIIGAGPFFVKDF
jgi:hypothetical protein